MERHFREKNTIWDAFYKNLPYVAILKNIKIFFPKKHLFFQKKKTNFERFENSFYFGRILRQNCYNLVKKNSRSDVNKNADVGVNALANIG